MDRKSVIILAVSVLLLMAWYPLTNKLFPPRVLPKSALTAHGTNRVATATNSVGTNAVGTNLANTVTNAAPIAQPPAEEHLEVLETADARYTFTSVGGGLKYVELKKFAAVISCDSKEKNSATNIACLNTKAPLPAFSISAEAGANGARSFHLSRTGETVRAEAMINSNGLYLIKEYRLSTNYTMQTLVRYENRSGAAVQLPERELVIGTATPMGQRDETMMLGLEWYNGSKTEKIIEPWFANYTMGCRMFGGTPRTEYRADTTNVSWAAVNNQFFTMIARPETNTPVSGVVGRRILLPVPTKDELKKDPQVFAHPVGYQTALLLPAQQMAPQSFYEYRFQLFAGPKEYKTLSRLPENMDLVMGFGGFFGFFAQALLLAMNGIHAIGIPYGLAIIVITVVIKGFFWPLTTASTRSMKRMAALQPQMKALQEKYKDDPRKMNSKLMEFMKENKVSPMGGCLPVLLQIPVFFGFYRMLQSAIELRGASFLWACDLSQPDTIFHIGGFPVNPLPLFMGATMLWQARLTPPSPGMDPAQQKMMKYMPLVMVVFLYNYSAGLALYWATQNLLSIAQMKLTKTTEPTPGGTAPAAGSAAARPKKK